MNPFHRSLPAMLALAAVMPHPSDLMYRRPVVAPPTKKSKHARKNEARRRMAKASRRRNRK
jgi:hypothetical protein